MKNSIKFFFYLIIVAFCNIYTECAPEPVYANQSANTLEGKWESYYFEHNGLDVTQQYQMTLQFDDQGQCVQTLVKPGATLSASLGYVMYENETTVVIGSANLIVDYYDGSHIRLRYNKGAQPAGFIEPWTADFLKTE